MGRTIVRAVASSSFVLLVLLAACGRSSPAEPNEAPNNSTATSSTTLTGGSTGSSTSGASPSSGGTPVSPDDPLKGNFSLADATKGLPGTGALSATITTSKGALTCKLYDDKAPVTVANFVGLARGIRPWKNPAGTWVTKPAYDGTTFHRVIKGFMIQGGDAKGNGTGEPGYVIKDELWGGKHDRAGLLCMANRGPNTNGAQFFITDAAAAHLDRSYTIFGECAPEQTVHDIANVEVQGEKPATPVVISSITIAKK